MHSCSTEIGMFVLNFAGMSNIASKLVTLVWIKNHYHTFSVRRRQVQGRLKHTRRHIRNKEP